MADLTNFLSLVLPHEFSKSRLDSTPQVVDRKYGTAKQISNVAYLGMSPIIMASLMLMY